MSAKREERHRPGWISDRLDSASPPEFDDPYFDDALNAWVFSRYQDVLAALRSPQLSPAGAHNARETELSDEQIRLQMREEILGKFNYVQLRSWRERLTPEVQSHADRLPADLPVDLLAGYATPLCLVLAAMVTGLDLRRAMELQEKAREISAAAAEPYDAALLSVAKSASAELSRSFHSGPASLRESGFVALSQTLPCILGNAWLALLNHPREWRLLHQQSELMEQAMEELLRYAGLVRVLFRKAKEDVILNGFLISKDDRLILRIWAANRDPGCCPDAGHLNIDRRGAGPLTFGAGPHACVAGSLLRMAAVTVTRPLLKRFSRADLSEPPKWRGGTIFRAPSSLFVRLNES